MRSNRANTLLASITLLSIIASSATAATQVYVDLAGSCGGMAPCFTSIQAGVNAAGGGPSTVSIFAGTYDESVDLSLMGSDGALAQDDLKIEAQGVVGSVIVAAMGKREAFYNSIDPFPANLAFIGLVISSNTTDGLDLEGVLGSVTVTDVEARDSVYDGLDIRADGDVTLTRVNAHHNGNDGVEIYIPGHDFELRNTLLPNQDSSDAQAAINETGRRGGTDDSSQRCFANAIGPNNFPSVFQRGATNTYEPWPPSPGADNLCGFPAPVPGAPRLNEFALGATAAFVEIYDGGAGNTSLDGLVLVLYGEDERSYRAFDLDGQSTGNTGYFVLCDDSGAVPNCDLDETPDSNLILGETTAAALYAGDDSDFPNGTLVTDVGVIDAIARNERLVEAVLMPLRGRPRAPDARCPNGAGGLRNNFAWASFNQVPRTPGEANTCRFVGPAIINEIDVDQGATDDAEFVELYDGGRGSTDLSDLVLVFYDGADDTSYAAFDLDGRSTDSDGYFVLCGNTANVANCDLDVTPDNELLVDRDGAIVLYNGDATGFPNGTPVTSTGMIDVAVYHISFGNVSITDSQSTDNGTFDGIPANDDEGFQIDVLNGHVTIERTRAERNGATGFDIQPLENGRILSLTVTESSAINNGYDGLQAQRPGRRTAALQNPSGDNERCGDIIISDFEALDNAHDGIELLCSDGVTGTHVFLEDIVSMRNGRVDDPRGPTIGDSELGDGLLVNITSTYDADAQPLNVTLQRATVSDNGEGIELRKTFDSVVEIGDMTLIDVTADDNDQSGMELNLSGDLVLTRIQANNNGRANVNDCNHDGIDMNASNGEALIPASIVATDIVAIGNSKDGVQLSAVGPITVDGIYAANNGTVGCLDERAYGDVPANHGDGLQVNGDSFMETPDEAVFGVADLTLTNCLFEDNVDDGADIRINGDVAVSDCEANRNGEDGIDVTDSNSNGVDTRVDYFPSGDLIENFGFQAFTAASVSLDGISVTANHDDGVDVGALGAIDMNDVCALEHTRAEPRRGEGIVVKLTGGPLTATNVTSSSNLNGFELLELGTGAFSIASSALTENTGAGMRSSVDNNITATNNWWGAADGPGPGGSGNPVIDGSFGGGDGAITAAPFLTEPIGVEECPERAQDIRDFLDGLGTIEIVLSAPPADDTPFPFTDSIVMAPATLNGGTPDFVLQDPSNPGQMFMRVPPGNYSVMQMVPPDWEIGSIECSENVDENSTPTGSGVSLVLDERETIICTFGNRLIPQPDGTECSDVSACTSGNCVDGVCCDQACDGEDQACNVAGSVGSCISTLTAPAPTLSRGGMLAAALVLLLAGAMGMARRIRALRTD